MGLNATLPASISDGPVSVNPTSLAWVPYGGDTCCPGFQLRRRVNVDCVCELVGGSRIGRAWTGDLKENHYFVVGADGRPPYTSLDPEVVPYVDGARRQTFHDKGGV